MARAANIPQILPSGTTVKICCKTPGVSYPRFAVVISHDDFDDTYLVHEYGKADGPTWWVKSRFISAADLPVPECVTTCSVCGREKHGETCTSCIMHDMKIRVTIYLTHHDYPV